MTVPSSFAMSSGKKKISLLLGSLVFFTLLLEVLLRIYLFYVPGDLLSLKWPAIYTQGMGSDDYWYYQHLWWDRTFFDKKPLAPASVSDMNFYAHWAASLEFDPLLGYKRKSNVTFPGHETSNLGTRGKKQYALGGEKIVFYGDSYVESNAPSENTLTAKMEKQSGVDCLNYGVGGYGLDQIYLLFEQTHKQFDPARTRCLIGVFGEDLQRMLLAVRQSAKPYFTVEDSRLALHTGHIDATNPKRFFETYKPHFRLFLGQLVVHKIKPLDDYFVARRQRQEDAKIGRASCRERV